MNIASAPIATCSRCRSDRHVVVGDGPNVCVPCIDLLAGAANDPMTVSARLRDVLSELHADIVTLGESDAGAQAWEWKGWL